MHPGPRIRRLFGPYEGVATEAYRKLFINLDEFSSILRGWVSNSTRILEVGCGEGAFTERLVAAYPEAEITAIDISPNLGRLFRGASTHVRFLRKTVEDVAREEAASFDLAVLCDVLHHVPPDLRGSLLSAIDEALAPGGSLAFKDWAPSFSPIHWLCVMSDRYLTGDVVQFCSASSAKALLQSVFGHNAIRREALVRPWKNNVAFLIRR